MGAANGKVSKEDIKELLKKTNYSKSEIDKLKGDYKKGDTDGKPGLSFEEFKIFFSKRFKDYDDASLLKMFCLFDVDSNGVLDFLEFIGALYLMTKASVEDKLSFLFDLFDQDDNGYINLDESIKLCNVVTACGVSFGMSVSESINFASTVMTYSNMKNPSLGFTKEEFISTCNKSENFLKIISFDYQS
ncbi:hypothetical protein DICPUDRAFT_99251 [Dictyostelium purpureum]|uniref:EF-hand domain-containing protein n=1 Tax=Dictyostelium purpureum TaxID=5786 RepID=F0ZXN9_DICPU|nr:uncharacterized protein DICPUDRAFT_99251 [Dictyostelium purpureum]EGC31306.1 hypothetical protein DICPUDRAFT_99251 [Dictyostelium purpureum]|eukprot:XP_003292183.1 hypothetical protein DICPUDRAFT_99251 [Dictyostelium purpureum]